MIHARAGFPVDCAHARSRPQGAEGAVNAPATLRCEAPSPPPHPARNPLLRHVALTCCDHAQYLQLWYASARLSCCASESPSWSPTPAASLSTPRVRLGSVPRIARTWRTSGPGGMRRRRRLPPCRRPRQPPTPAPRAAAAPITTMDQRHGSLRLRVVTLNTWGLWLVSRRRAERMVALAAWLRE